MRSLLQSLRQASPCSPTGRLTRKQAIYFRTTPYVLQSGSVSLDCGNSGITRALRRRSHGERSNAHSRPTALATLTPRRQLPGAA